MSAQVEPQAQTSLYETIVDDAGLEAELEKRETLKQQSKAVSKKYRDQDAVVKAGLEKLELGFDAAVRIGRFVVSLKEIEGRKVSFEVAPSTRLRIRPLDEAA